MASNHISGVDPILLQTFFPRPIRWMMQRSMMIAVLRPIWRMLQVIPVETSGTASIREAFRHLADGGVVGIFPEGQIARPPGRIQVFHPGLAIIAQRTKVPVAIFAIDGMPPCGNPFWSLIRRGRARVQFLGIIDPPAAGDEAAWTRKIRLRIAQAIGATVDDADGADNADGADGASG